MINIVLNRSQQPYNKCVQGDNEQEHTGLICDAVFNILIKDNRLNVLNIPPQNGADMSNLKESVKISNDFINRYGGKGYHLSIHSDAGYEGGGSSGFYYSDSGRDFGRPIYEKMCALTPWSDMSFYKREGLYELKHTTAVAFLLEISFHDKPNESEWIHNNINNIAQVIASGIYRGIGLDQPDMTTEEAINILVKNEIIKTPEYWILNAKPGSQCVGEYVSELIKRMAKKMV